MLLSFGAKPHPPSIVLVSSFSEPGPTWHNLSQHPASEWTHLSVNRSAVGSEAPDSSGLQLLAHVDAVRPGWKLQRSVWISLPLQHGSVSAVFVNDTLTVTGAAVRGFWVSHAALLVGAEPATAIQCVAELRRMPQARQPGNATAPVRAVKNQSVCVDTRLTSHNTTTMRLFIHQNVKKAS